MQCPPQQLRVRAERHNNEIIMMKVKLQHTTISHKDPPDIYSNAR